MFKVGEYAVMYFKIYELGRSIARTIKRIWTITINARRFYCNLNYW